MPSIIWYPSAPSTLSFMIKATIVGDRTGLERRVRNNRRSKLDEYITSRVSIRNGNITDRRTDNRRLKDNSFVNNWLEKFHAEGRMHR
jgi:hypothetical protein